MHAVILAGGKGLRLRPYTTALPKPLMPIGDKHAILEIILQQLSSCGFTSATLAINHLGRLIRAFAEDGSRWGMKIDYIEESTPLSTVGPLFYLKNMLPDEFLVMNGDLLTDLDYGDLLHAHVLSGELLTVATAKRNAKVDFGVLTITDGKIVGFTEKPSMVYRVSMGIYGMSRKAIDHYPAGIALGFDQLILNLLGSNQYPATYAFDGFWLDIGRPEDYDQANTTFEKLKPVLLPKDYGELL